ncbi:hypothetical protein HF324_30905 [Chitinophaga oryzae]|uniref:Uncharacterized protein n=1 Tax=Chitinophaga oryzae TaxID=2725414 RepID=A0AAE7DA29_9BACT|nr:hypothetical protein [Chitinophaga oryzae]QJB35476.1 hypothetical protein HF329_30885 [Chitinophaga oryzae]QJB42019.1 hypothetical protein HF324_30905 [Chitinophaga oryzae]
MQIVNKIDLKHRISKSLINESGSRALILFDNSSEFAVIDIIEDQLTLSYCHQFEFVILDACFSAGDRIWFALNGSGNIEWNIDARSISRTCGDVVQNNLSPHLNGYSCIRAIPSKNLLIAANAGSFKIEFYHLDTLSKWENSDALCEVYTKNIIVHPNQQIIAVQITESEDTGSIRFFEIKDNSVRLYKRYISTLFSPGACNFSENGKEIITTGGFPPFSYQVNRFPSLEFVNEFTDDGGLNMPGPWGNTRGITFNNDFLISSSKLIIPYYNGHICQIEQETGKIFDSVKCCDSLCSSLTRSQNGQLLLCSAIGGEVALLRNSDLEFNIGPEAIQLEEPDTTTNLLLPLATMKEVASSLDEPLQIRYELNK